MSDACSAEETTPIVAAVRGMHAQIERALVAGDVASARRLHEAVGALLIVPATEWAGVVLAIDDARSRRGR